MMIKKTSFSLSLCLWFAVSATLTNGQSKANRRDHDSTASINYGFVSPNTAENLTLQVAIRNLSSADEALLVSKANDLGCRMQIRLRALRALGSWRDGAENSILVLTHGDEDSIRYLLATLGRDARQKSVLYFHRKNGGPAKLYILYSRLTIYRLNRLATMLDQIGIDSRTLVPQKQRTAVYIVDSKGQMQTKLRTLASRLRTKVQVENGTAEFIGDDVDREKAASVFQTEIATYETSHPPLPPTCRASRRRKLAK